MDAFASILTHSWRLAGRLAVARRVVIGLQGRDHVAPALDNKTFHQESVLREDEQPSCVSFEAMARYQVTFDDDVLADVHHRAECCQPCRHRGLVFAGGVWCRCQPGSQPRLLDRCLEERTKGL